MIVKNRVELKGYIRYQLAQLGARNGEHEFENLCFELARLRLVPNLVPATGPVKAGGDQGRDFESYRTYLAGSQLARSTFATLASADIVVGACTLNKQTSTKIRSDLVVICEPENRPDRVLYFCEPDLPVAKRHELQRGCAIGHGPSLEIFDGQAIADLLSDRDTFWIAEQFLAVPAEFFPRDDVDEEYEALRQKWLLRSEAAKNYADFLDVKLGLRTAVAEDFARPDLLRWITCMEAFASEDSSDRLRQKARYEIAVAELRGRGSLDPAKSHLEGYFGSLNSNQSPAGILDAAVLATYCAAARGHGQTTMISETVINEWVTEVRDLVRSMMARVDRKGEKCSLLEARAMLSSIPGPGAKPGDVLDEALDCWRAVIDEVSNVPFYPVSHIAELIEILGPIVGHSSRFRELRDKIDCLVEERAGAHEVAERSRRRAAAYLKSGNRLAAIDELQRAKVGWFSGENMPGSVLAMLVLADCYSELGLHIAARYYAAGAAYIALHSEDERVRARLPRACFTLVQTFYSGGEGLTYVLCLGQVIGTHVLLARDPLDVDAHPELGRALAHAAIYRAAAARLAPHLLALIDRAVESWPMDKADVNAVLEMANSRWESMTPTDFEEAIERDLGASPFSDVGSAREIRWSALGIVWTVRCSAQRESLLAALEVVATLQILQVEFADAELLIVPSEAVIDIEIGAISEPECSQLPDNDRLAWRIVLPREGDKEESLSRTAAESLALATAVIGQATALDQQGFEKIVRERLERGLPLRSFSVRPARELMDFALAQAGGWNELAGLEPVGLSRWINPHEAPELAWKVGPGPGYTRERANEFLENRYRRSSQAIWRTLPIILKDVSARKLIEELKSEGALDWHVITILANIVVQRQVEIVTGHPISAESLPLIKDRMNRFEQPSDPHFDVNLITPERIRIQEQMLTAAAFNTWDLVVNRPTPNFSGMKLLLDERYGHSTDDVPHEDPFLLG